MRRPQAPALGFTPYHLAIVRASPRLIDADYLLRAFQSCAINQQFQVAASGVTRYGLPKASIGDAQIPLPDPTEQRAIAAFLDKETDRLDTRTTKKWELIEKLKEKRTALISRTVKRGLNPNAKLKPSGIEWLGEIPSRWVANRVKFLGLIRYGLGEPPEYVDDGLPFIRATDIKRGKIEMDAVRKVRREDIPWSRRPELAENEILVVRSGAYTGDSAIVTKEIAGCIAGYDMVVSVSKGSPKFYSWVFLSKYMLQSQIHLARLRAAQPHLVNDNHFFPLATIIICQ